MPEPLIRSDHVVGEWDPLAQGFAARDWTPGPAGTVGLTLRGDVELEIDVASPGTFVGLWVDADHGGMGRPTTEAMERLLGRERLFDLLALQKQPGSPKILRPLNDDQPRNIRPRRGHPSDPGSLRGTDPNPPRGVAPGLARVALAAATGTEPTASALVHALAHIDAALAASIFQPGIGFGTRARTDAAVGAELLLDVVRRGELDGQAVDELELADALRGLVTLLPEGLDDQIRSLARTMTRRSDDEAARAYPAAAASPPPSTDAMELRHLTESPRPRQRALAPILAALDRRTLPSELAAEQIVVRATTPSELEVRIAHPGPSDGWWARAYGPDDVIVAASPFLAAQGDAVARLLVPPDRLAEVEVDITGQPGEPRPSRRLRTIADAVRHGQAAARSERLGDIRAARERWQRSSRAWDQAGDPARSGQAMELADGGGRDRDRGRVPPALLTDALVEAASE